MEIKLGKTYRNGRGQKVRIICVDRNSNNYPIVGLNGPDAEVITYTATGKFSTDSREPSEDLIAEVSEWDVVAIDTKVIVTDSRGNELARYFAGINDGNPTTFAYGATAWSNKFNDMVPQVWAKMRLAS